MKFTYIDRCHCVCGASLAPPAARVVEREAAWGTVRFVECRECGSWCQSPQVSPASLAAWYDSDAYQGSSVERGSAYLNYLSDEPERRREASRRFHRDLEPWLPASGAHVLEIGCATASLLSVIHDAGHQVAGVDLSPRFASAAHQLYGIDVQVGDFRGLPLPAAAFDLVLLLGTLSNLSDLPAALASIRALLRPAGVLIANHPGADSVIARIYGARFWMFAPSASTFLTRAGARLALERSGFRVERERTDRQMPSLRKLLNHAKAGRVAALLDRAGAGGIGVPFPLPIPGVRLVVARAA